MYTHTLSLTHTHTKSRQFPSGLSYSVKVTLWHPIRTIMYSCSPLPVSSPQSKTNNEAWAPQVTGANHHLNGTITHTCVRLRLLIS